MVGFVVAKRAGVSRLVLFAFYVFRVGSVEVEVRVFVPAGRNRNNFRVPAAASLSVAGVLNGINTCYAVFLSPRLG